MQKGDLLKKRLIAVTGKGGVGKSVVSAALALAMASKGRRVLVASMHRGVRTAGFFGAPTASGELFPVQENLWAVNVTPQASLHEYGLMILKFERLYRAVFEDRLVKYLLEALPSLEELVMFGKTWFHAQEKWKDGSSRFDTVIMDCQATGHAISMLSLPGTIAEAAPPGPLKSKAQEMHSMLTERGGSAMCIVSTPEEMPVNEASMLWNANRESIGIPDCCLAMNRVIDPLFDDGELEGLGADLAPMVGTAVRCARLRKTAASNQSAHIRRAGEELPPPVFSLPELYTRDFGMVEAERLAKRILEGGVGRK
jgi:anion-transporting  ArsA/GET3 family ATPase